MFFIGEHFIALIDFTTNFTRHCWPCELVYTLALPKEQIRVPVMALGLFRLVLMCWNIITDPGEVLPISLTQTT